MTARNTFLFGAALAAATAAVAVDHYNHPFERAVTQSAPAAGGAPCAAAAPCAAGAPKLAAPPPPPTRAPAAPCAASAPCSASVPKLAPPPPPAKSKLAPPPPPAPLPAGQGTAG